MQRGCPPLPLSISSQVHASGGAHHIQSRRCVPCCLSHHVFTRRFSRLLLCFLQGWRRVSFPNASSFCTPADCTPPGPPGRGGAVCARFLSDGLNACRPRLSLALPRCSGLVRFLPHPTHYLSSYFAAINSRPCAWPYRSRSHMSFSSRYVD